MRDILKKSKVKLIILLLVFSFGFTAPFYYSSGAGAIAYITKEFGLDLIARTIARRLLTNLGNGVIQSINNLGVEGGQRSPSFVQNWKSFLSSAQTIGENQFRAQLNYAIQRGVICDDFKGPLALAFQARDIPFVDIGDPQKNAELKQNTLVPYQSKIRCTIPDRTRAEFKRDFERGGGWDTWNRMLEPQNNLAGATLLSIEELQKQRASQEESQGKEAVAGQGFQGVKGACQQAVPAQARETVCYRNCQVNIPLSVEVSQRDSHCLNQCRGQTALGANAQCSFLGKTVTPAKILGDGASKFLDSNAEFLVSSDELSEILVSMIGQVLGKLANLAANELADFATRELTNLITTDSPTDAGDVIEQQAPNFLPDAQQDRETIEEIRENSENFENPEDNPNFQGQ
ncbi:MAG: hypothetical protein A3C71_01405 [Candidatus Yanofskybacteria bacterium RIFCSPHIGHO2_02_FULL_43_15c]|uniref:Uncharacterized protein n=1 Tax=Candidatus Yanofskybacteria bacterium RIFCSPHIGHO2_02_FULL_43_15c TaxID=1802679 RepID=A0A1F8FJS4_9BACT|nr:MAG: hypothetical protein A3C71_01405 [Candidatus Yanofskybacteria bacterium RIFCSPHIGHO2_02_FULL_43_15c]